MRIPRIFIRRRKWIFESGRKSKTLPVIPPFIIPGAVFIRRVSEMAELCLRGYKFNS